MLYERYPALSGCKEEIEKALRLMIETYKNGGKILICGNGGSCADSGHIVGELMKGFLLKRPLCEEKKNLIKNVIPEEYDLFASKLQESLPAIALDSQNALITAFANDVDPDLIYAQSVLGYGKKGDLFIGLSTSGNSKNVVFGAKMAKALGLKTVALTGKCESKLSEICDVTIKAPETETYKVQEYHLPIYHYLCAEIEKCFFI